MLVLVPKVCIGLTPLVCIGLTLLANALGVVLVVAVPEIATWLPEQMAQGPR